MSLPPHWLWYFSSTLGGHRGCRGMLNMCTKCTAINEDGLSTPANVSETANLPAGGAVLRTDEPERPKNQSDTSDVCTDTQHCKQPENTTEIVRNSQNNGRSENLVCGQVKWLGKPCGHVKWMHGHAEHFRDQKPAENANKNVKTRQVRPRCEIHLKNLGPQCQRMPNGGNLSEMI